MLIILKETRKNKMTFLLWQSNCIYLEENQKEVSLDRRSARRCHYFFQLFLSINLSFNDIHTY